MKYRNFNDGIPFNCTSHRVFVSGPDFSAPGRVHPASEYNAMSSMVNAFMSFRKQDGHYTDIPVAEYSSNNWSSFGAVNYSYGNRTYFAPSIDPRYSATDPINKPYLFNGFTRNANGSLKQTSNRGFWTTTFTPVTSSRKVYNFHFFVSMILLLSNASTSPTVTPDEFNMLAFVNATDPITNDNWIRYGSNLSVTASEIKTLASGFDSVGGTNKYYKVIAVKTLTNRGPDTSAYQVYGPQLEEMSIPLISFKNPTNGDEVGFLEIEFNISEPRGTT